MKYGTFLYSQAPYGGRTRVYQSETLIWNLYAIVAQQLTIKWNLLTQIYQTLTVKWNLFDRIYQQVSIKWSLFAQIYQTSTIKWDIYNKITQTLTIVCVLYAERSNLLRLKWNLRSFTGLFFSPSIKPTTAYNTISGVSTVYNTVSKNLNNIWTNIKATGNKYGTFKYGQRKYGRIGITKSTKPTTNYNNINEVQQ